MDIIFSVFTIFFLFRTAFFDPGIIPRNLNDGYTDIDLFKIPTDSFRYNYAFIMNTCNNTGLFKYCGTC